MRFRAVPDESDNRIDVNVEIQVATEDQTSVPRVFGLARRKNLAPVLLFHALRQTFFPQHARADARPVNRTLRAHECSLRSDRLTSSLLPPFLHEP